MKISALVTSQRWFRFALAGTGNTLLSQALLVLLLGVIPVGAATLASQVVHACCGYFTSSKAVFKRVGSPWRYGAMVAVCWLLQWQALAGLLRAGVPRALAVALLVPVLALTSYGLQRRLVFR